jgi:hypothetical protein
MTEEFIVNKKQRVGDVDEKIDIQVVENVGEPCIPVRTMQMTGWECNCRAAPPVITFKTFNATIDPDAPDATVETLWSLIDKGIVNEDTVSLLTTYCEMKLLIPVEPDARAMVVFVIQKVIIITGEDPLPEMEPSPTFEVGTKWKLGYWIYNARCETMVYVDNHVVEVVSGTVQTPENKAHYRKAMNVNNFELCTRMPVAMIDGHLNTALRKNESNVILFGVKMIMVSITAQQ